MRLRIFNLLIMINVVGFVRIMRNNEIREKIENKQKLLAYIENNLSLVRYTQNMTDNINRRCLRSNFRRIRRWLSQKASKQRASQTESKCLTDTKVAIVVPYRNRQKHLSVLVNNLHVFLSDKNISYTIFVIELAQPTRFNRGLLLNAGYIISNQLGMYTCFIFHDVDLIPMDKRIPYKCEHMPLHMASGNSKFDGKMPYENYFGGVTMVGKEHFEQINGFSNFFFGWGGEDDDFLLRFQTNNISIKRLSPSIGRFFALAHDQDDGNPINDFRHHLLEKALERQTVDGISSVNFKLLAFDVHPLYLWYLVDIS